MVENYHLSIFFSHACFHDITRRTERKYGNQKLRVVWTKKGLRRDKRKTLARPSLTLNTYSTFKNSWVMYGALFRRSGPNTNSLLLRLYTKDKSVRFCFKILFFCVKNNKLYWFLSAQGLKVNSLINDFIKEYSVRVTLSSWLLFVVFFLALFVPWAVKALHNVF